MKDSIEVRLIQAMLLGLGYSIGQADGIMGPKTRQALGSLTPELQVWVQGKAQEIASSSEVQSALENLKTSLEVTKDVENNTQLPPSMLDYPHRMPNEAFSYKGGMYVPFSYDELKKSYELLESKYSDVPFSFMELVWHHENYPDGRSKTDKLVKVSGSYRGFAQWGKSSWNSKDLQKGRDVPPWELACFGLYHQMVMTCRYYHYHKIRFVGFAKANGRNTTFTDEMAYLCHGQGWGGAQRILKFGLGTKSVTNGTVMYSNVLGAQSLKAYDTWKLANRQFSDNVVG